MVLLTDVNGKVIIINAEAARWYDKKPEDMTGSSIYSFMPQKLAKLRRKKALEAIQKKQPIHYNERRGSRYFDTRIFPIMDLEGHVKSLAIFARDFTGHVNGRKELRKARDDLENRVAERTREIWPD